MFLSFLLIFDFRKNLFEKKYFRPKKPLNEPTEKIGLLLLMK